MALSVTTSGSVMRITLSRPTAHNVLDLDVVTSLAAVLLPLQATGNLPPKYNGNKPSARHKQQQQQQQHAESIRAVVLASLGPSFCAGADLRAFALGAPYKPTSGNEEGCRGGTGRCTSANGGSKSKIKSSSSSSSYAGEFAAGLFGALRAIRGCRVPVIARVDGRALGGGAGIVAACDVAMVTRRSSFGFPEIFSGLVPAVVSPYVMRRTGPKWCSSAFLLGKTFSSEEALAAGLVDNVWPSTDELDSAVNKACHEICIASPTAVAEAKKIISYVEGEDDKLDAVQKHLCVSLETAVNSHDGQEGITAFLNKQKPAWKQHNTHNS
ncbi:enoyl-CoA hydratase [Pelomyxa schiedti]|nr:enoyl-CoA hydratase [Pelomyxa schiedti]